MAKNVTGGIVLLLAGSVAIAFAATDKGRAIIGVLTSSSGSPASGSSGAGSPASGSSPGTGRGFGGFGSSTETRGGDGRVAPISVGSYKDILYPGAFVGEKAAIAL